MKKLTNPQNDVRFLNNRGLITQVYVTAFVCERFKGEG